MLTKRAPVASAAASTPALQGREPRGPLGVGRVEGLVDDTGTPGGCGGEARIASVTPDHLDVVGNGGVAGSVHEPHPLAPASERLEGRDADRPGPEDDVLSGSHTVASIPASSDGSSPVVRTGRRTWSRRPDKAEKVSAPKAPKIVNCSSTWIWPRVVTVQPSAHRAGIAAAHAQRLRVRRGRASACAGPRKTPVRAPIRARSASEVP